MLEEIIAGQNDPEYLASLALGHLRAKTPQLKLALEGKIRPHHRFLLRRLLDQLRFVEHEIVLLDPRSSRTRQRTHGAGEHGTRIDEILRRAAAEVWLRTGE